MSRPVDVEFVDGPSPSDEPADELAPGRPRLPRWAPLGVVAVLAAGAIAVVAQRGGDPVPRAAASSSATTSTASVAPSASTEPMPVVPVPPFPVNSAVPQQISTLDPTLFGVYSTARSPGRAQDVIRTGSTAGNCRQVKVGTDPQGTVARSLARTLPGYRRLDLARIIDIDAALCSVQVRARDRNGIVAVLRVIAPDGGRDREFVHSGDGTVAGSRVEYSEYRSAAGWHVIVGAVVASGRRDLLPGRDVLQQLSMSAALYW